MAFIRIASVVTATVALGLSGVVAGCSAGSSTSSEESGGSTSSSLEASAPAAPLDGSFRIVTKFSQGTTFDGSPVPGGTDVSRWYAFRSACTPAGCTAATTQLDTNDHGVAMPNGATATLRFADGRWQTIAPIDGTVACKANPEVRLKIATSLSFAPQSDGTLAGTKVYTELKGGAGECAGTGRTAKYPITLVREGAVPANVVVADPPPA